MHLPMMALALPAAPAIERYLVVGASDSSPQKIVVRATDLEKRTRVKGMIFQVADCGERRALFGWASKLVETTEQAQKELASLKAAVPDSFIKKCHVKPGSVLSFGLPAVDPSIGQVPVSAVNWSDADRVSTVIRLGNAGTLALVRYFRDDPNSPLEGRHSRVQFAKDGGELKTLAEDCTGVATAVHTAKLIAFACESEQAADNILHTVRVFSVSGSDVGSFPRCRKPTLVEPDLMRCDAEEVLPDGSLKLKSKSNKITLP